MKICLIDYFNITWEILKFSQICSIYQLKSLISFAALSSNDFKLSLILIKYDRYLVFLTKNYE